MTAQRQIVASIFEVNLRRQPRSSIHFWTTLARLTSALLFIASIAMAQAQTFTVLHDFTGGVDGSDPYGGLTIDRNGRLYGTTFGLPRIVWVLGSPLASNGSLLLSQFPAMHLFRFTIEKIFSYRPR
jgi:hypothetical protein